MVKCECLNISGIWVTGWSIFPGATSPNLLSLIPEAMEFTIIYFATFSTTIQWYTLLYLDSRSCPGLCHYLYLNPWNNFLQYPSSNYSLSFPCFRYNYESNCLLTLNSLLILLWLLCLYPYFFIWKSGFLYFHHFLLSDLKLSAPSSIWRQQFLIYQYICHFCTPFLSIN